MPILLYIYIYLNVSPELWVHTQNLIDKTYTGTNVQIWNPPKFNQTRILPLPSATFSNDFDFFGLSPWDKVCSVTRSSSGFGLWWTNIESKAQIL